MDFSDDEIRALAAFLARRLTPELRPLDPTDAPVYGASAFDQWQSTLRRARASGRLARLFRDAARALPDDPALEKAAALVQESHWSDRLRFGAGALTLATAAVLLVSFGAVVTTLALSVGTAVVAELRSPGGGPESAAVIESRSIAVAAKDPSLGGLGSDAPPVELLVGSTEIPRAEDGPPGESMEERAESDGPCRVDGWFYAGTETPSERFVAPHALHVRAEPPSRNNGWNSRTEVRCYLGKGDIVRLDQAPLELPGHHYWVHLAPEAVSRPVGLAMR